MNSKNIKLLALTATLALPMLSNAETLFYCKTTKGKQIKVEKHGKIISYAFGKNLKKPELALRKPISEVTLRPWGATSGHANIIAFDNGGYEYELQVGERYDNKVREFGWLGVYKKGRELAVIRCIPKTIPKSTTELRVW